MVMVVELRGEQFLPTAIYHRVRQSARAHPHAALARRGKSPRHAEGKEYTNLPFLLSLPPRARNRASKACFKAHCDTPGPVYLLL